MVVFAFGDVVAGVLLNRVWVCFGLGFSTLTGLLEKTGLGAGLGVGLGDGLIGDVVGGVVVLPGVIAGAGVARCCAKSQA
jgi:hypothetical protein